jgi:glycosyltransferase involved in cell wall biosynthesis
MGAPILQVITDTDRRGAQVFATDLHAAFERSGREVETVALAPGTTGGLDVPVLGDRRMGPGTLRSLRRRLEASSVAIAHGSTTLPACAIASIATGTPFVYRQISDSRFWAPSGLRRMRVRLGLGRAAAVVALWSGSAETLHDHFGVAPERIRVIPNGVPVGRFTPVTPDERDAQRRAFGLDPTRPTLLYVGALAPEKGVDLVIDAVAELADAQLLVVGDGPERAALEAKAQRVAPDRVVFAGSVPDIVGAYASADLFVLASRGGDSMPAVLIEASLCAVPAVATDIEAIPEVVLHGVTGRIVSAGSLDQLVEALTALLQHPDRAVTLGRAAREHCLQQFDIDAIAARWLSVLEAVAPSR